MSVGRDGPSWSASLPGPQATALSAGYEGFRQVRANLEKLAEPRSRLECPLSHPAPETAMALVLHYHPLSSCCHKVLIALYELGLPFEPRLLNLGDAQARAAHLARWPTGKMPLLEDDGLTVPETSIIIEHLQQRHVGAVRLLPADPEGALEVRLWDRLCDQYVMTPMQALVAQRLRAPAERDARAADEARFSVPGGATPPA